MVEISVIIPVYNTEKYLKECLDHITNQTFTDIEIICVNDGSTDKSPEILEKYSENDERIIIINQSNQGLSASRNNGLKKAHGKYVYFTDSDDYLNLDALEQLHDIILKNNVDFIIFKMNNFHDDTHEIITDSYYEIPYLKNYTVFNYSDVSRDALKIAVNTPCNFFKREFINDLRFPEGLLYEDNVFFTQALFKANNIYFYDKKLYNRRVRGDSLSNNVSVKSLDTIEITNILLNLCRQYNHPHHKKELYYRIFNNIYSVFEKSPESLKAELFAEMKKRYLKYSDEWLNDDYFTDKLNPRLKNIYESTVKSDSSSEFELRVKIFDSNKKILKLKKENKKLKRELDKVKKENNEIKSTKGYKLLKRLC